MMTFTAREAKNRFGEVLQESQRQEVTITRNGRPYARVVGLERASHDTALEELIEQENTLLSFLNVAASPESKTSPEDRIRQLRDEW